MSSVLKKVLPAPKKKGSRGVKSTPKINKAKLSVRERRAHYPPNASALAKSVEAIIPVAAALRSRLSADPHSLLDAQALTRSMVRGVLAGRGERILVWLPNGPITVTSSAGSLIQLTYSAQLSNCAGYAEWITIFGTYRIRKAHYQYTPFFKGTGTNTGVCVGGVCYGNDIALPSSFSAAQQLDESRLWPMTDHESWNADFGAGYSDYIAISAPSTVYASVKIYSFAASGVGISTNYGVMTGKILVEFEGLL